MFQDEIGVVRITDETTTIEQVGGKAINLAKMISAGFNVPAAFVVSVDTYERFLDRIGLRERIAQELAGFDYEDDDALLEGTGRIRDMIMKEALSQDVVDAIHSAIDDLGGDYYAVRSSAVAEDLAEASFAGQQDTFLNVKKEDVIEMVLACWASFWNDRAVKYRHDASVDHMASGIAVVVQRMIRSEISGVMFTVNPVDGGDDIVIESSWGLGESIASGIVTPDKYTLGRDGKVKSTIVKSKEKGYFLIDGRNTLVDIEPDKVDARCANDETLIDVAQVGLKLEKHFGVPQDIEWAMEAGAVYVLQSRAVTTLTDESDRDGILWTRAYGDEYWADATTPMFYDVMGKMLTEYVNHEGAKMMGYKDLESGPLMKLHKTRVYFSTEVLERVFAHYPKFIRSKELLNYFPIKEQERISAYPNDWYGTVMSQVHVFFRDRDGMMNKTDRKYKEWAIGFLGFCANEVDCVDFTKLSIGELTDLYDLVERRATKHYQLIRYGMVSHSIVTNLFVKNFLSKWLDDDGTLYAGLISGLPDNKTVSTNVGFSRLGKIIRENSELKRRTEEMSEEEFIEWMDNNDNLLKAEFDSFIEMYGHRSNTREIMAPRWKEDRPYVLSVAKMLSETDLDLSKLETQRKEDRQKIQDDVFARISKLRFGFVKRKIFKIVLNLAQTYLVFRENQRFYLDHILFRQRLLVREMGRRLAECGCISSMDDVFFLHIDEVRALLSENRDVRNEVSDRKKEFHRYKDVLPPKFLKNGIDFDDTVVDVMDTIYGASSSPGTYTGTVRVVEDIRALSQVQEGEILVTSNTDPGWTAVFSRLGGLITETGGILSHGAVISREYRIPAVTAVKGATTLLHTGQKVTVDGNEGAIYIIKEEKE